MNVILFALSFIFVAFGQPSWIPWVGILSAACGYGLFWKVFREISSVKRRLLLAVFWYSAIQAVQLSWMSSTKYQGIFIVLVYLILILILGCQFGLTSMLLPVHRKLKWMDILAIASFWVFMEWSRLFLLCGLSLNFSGMALSCFVLPMQMASIFGILGLSFYVFATNLIFLHFLETKMEVIKAMLWVAVAFFPYLFGLGYIKSISLFAQTEAKEMSIALVQTDLTPSEKIFLDSAPDDFINPLEQWRRILASLKQTNLEKIDLIVMPEAVVPYGYDRPTYELTLAKDLLREVLGNGVERHFPKLTWPNATGTKIDKGNRYYVSNAFFSNTITNFYDAELIIGLDYEQKEEQKYYNSAFHFMPGVAFQNRYDKQILVPMGEYLPFAWCRKLAEKFGITDFFSQGKESRLFYGKVPMGISICYEETFSKIMRQFSNEGALLFVNLTNDAWYPNTNLFKQHLYHARIRAVENGVPHVRACNGGVSAFIDSFGEIILNLEKGEKTLHCIMPIKTHPTLYQIWGDALILGFCVVFIFWRLISFLLDFFARKESYNFNRSSAVK